MDSKFYIIGTGGQAKETADFCRRIGKKFIFVSENRFESFQDCYTVVEGEMEPNSEYIIGIGNIAKRIEISYRLDNIGHIPCSIIDPSAIVLGKIDCGTIVAPGAIISSGAKIGKHCNINLNATVSHDCVVGDYSQISPGAHLNGNVLLKEGVFVGSGAVILPGVKVGANAIIGAGAVVTKDVEKNATVVGIPARKLGEKK